MNKVTQSIDNVIKNKIVFLVKGRFKNKSNVSKMIMQVL